jgi:hypothetical protein
MKNPNHQWFAFVPSEQETRKTTSPTHYLPNRGVITIKPEIAQYIAECERQGVPPKLFGAGWWDEDLQEFRVGLSVPDPAAKKKTKHSKPTDWVK